jgi:hypothetical protein
MMRFTSNGARIMNELATNADVAAGKVDRITAAVSRLRNASTMVAGGIALIGTAIDVYGVSQAAKLELALTGLYSATDANASQRTQLQNMVMHISSITAQTATTITNEAFMAASAGLNSPDRLRAAFPTIAKAADVEESRFSPALTRARARGDGPVRVATQIQEMPRFRSVVG